MPLVEQPPSRTLALTMGTPSTSNLQRLRERLQEELASPDGRQNLLSLKQTIEDLGSLADRCRARAGWHGGTRSISAGVEFAAGVTGLVGLCIITGGVASPVAITLCTIGTIGAATGGATSLANVLVQWGMDKRDAAEMQGRIDEIVPVLQRWERQYMELLEAFAEQHAGVGQPESSEHFCQMVYHCSHSARMAIEILELLKDIVTSASWQKGLPGNGPAAQLLVELALLSLSLVDSIKSWTAEPECLKPQISSTPPQTG